MNHFSLQQLVTSAGKRMRENLAERMVAHPGELGVGREEIIRRFLRAYIPARFEVSTGFVFDSKGNLSKQLDIVIANASPARASRRPEAIGSTPASQSSRSAK